MNLPDFSVHVGLNRLRERMGAELIPWNSEKFWQPTDFDKILVKTGIEISPSEIEIDFDGTFEYKGRKVVVYIRDQYKSSYSNPDELNKLHIVDCGTLQVMRRQGKYQRYVVTTRTDGLFIVNFLGSFGSGIQEKGVERKLYVCINCLKRLNYNNYNRLGCPERNEIRRCFDLAEFFVRYPAQIVNPPRHTDITAPLNIYSRHSEQISRRYREIMEWKCEGCQVSLGDGEMGRFLHVHHVNGLRHDNRNENLRALCIKCHAEQPQHQHLRNGRDYVEYLRNLQNRRRHDV